MTNRDDEQVALIGGTGAQGRALALRFAHAGVRVRIGSRDAKRADDAVAALVELAPSTRDVLAGGTNVEVVDASDIVVLAVPWDAHASTVRDLATSLADKILIDCVNPLGFDERGPFLVDVPEGSAAQQAQALAPNATVVAAFHHVSAPYLMDLSRTSIDLDVLVLGDDREAVASVISLAETIPGVRGIAAGRLRNARQVEGLTANLIAINRRYKAHSGLRITDVNIRAT